MNPKAKVLTIEDVESFYKEADAIYPLSAALLDEPNRITDARRLLVLRELHVAVRSALQLYGGEMRIIHNVNDYPVYLFALEKDEPVCLEAGRITDKFLVDFLPEILDKLEPQKTNLDASAKRLKELIQEKIVQIVFHLFWCFQNGEIQLKTKPFPNQAKERGCEKNNK
ncbi:MAG TPA: hypothetical protein PLV55_05965 [Anaerohalosphaeraceae bacterium]|nr:hypothetical protein [Anaerohalosphaeraceae bacterium]